MRMEDIKCRQKVIYVAKHLQRATPWNTQHYIDMGFSTHNSTEEKLNLGIVNSKNDKYVFVVFYGTTNGVACSPGDLFSLEKRPDLAGKIRDILTGE